ncbi:GldL-related protein [Chryseobacterium sp.]|uniref:GldL-related protein n=1 Tax=Chryseobacterium sp. TaxID=1871047 RepID=UPI0011C8A266|nr:PLDc N-terminal domain-containing protein [Chryseobacterium sp.]TXF77274.1 hypothetical protein FUA25_04870 [Chryseobacterium sp.]
MNVSPMLIDRRTLLGLAFLSLAIILIGALLKITHFSIGPITGNYLLAVGLVPGFFVWALVIYDILKHSFRNSLLWLIGIIFFGNLGCIVYLLQRDELVTRR